MIYIGKAVNIKERVKNHFNQPSYRDNLFIKNVSKIGFIETGSEIEALILEARLIKKHLPKFNVVWRDDKNYFYVAIDKNKDKLPYIYITHQIHQSKILNLKSKITYIGPFVEGNALKKTLKFLRRVFPYYTSQRHPQNKCTWCHLDLCPGPNPNLADYKKNIKKLTLILEGKRKTALYSLKREMKSFSNSEDFENARKVRDKIYALEHVMAHTHVIESQKSNIKNQNELGEKWDNTQKMLQSILKINNSIKKIECYDISNIQGKSATGSMVVFVNGKPDKSQYKKFRIRGDSSPTNFGVNEENKKSGKKIHSPKLVGDKPNDIAMLKEILTRRFLHSEWPYPEIILIDGGIAQRNIAIATRDKRQATRKNTLQKTRYSVFSGQARVISIAKGRQELFIEGKKRPIPLKALPQEVYNLIKYLDDEAHRFALTYHKKLRRTALGLAH